MHAPTSGNNTFYVAIECRLFKDLPYLLVSIPGEGYSIKISPIPPADQREAIILEQLQLYREQNPSHLPDKSGEVAGLLGE